MKKSLLEICTETLEAAKAAELGGANRIELCEQLAIGGLTPCAALLRAVRGAVKIPIHSMIRPRGGEFCFSPEEFRQMKEEIRVAQSEGMNGLVLGLLECNREIDFARTAELVLAAKPLPVTFHRAFDEAPDLASALEAVVATGAARILTSGGAPDAAAGSAKLSALVKSAGERITIMPGGGIRPENLRQIVQATRAAEFHSGLSYLRRNGQTDWAKFEASVRELSQALA